MQMWQMGLINADVLNVCIVPTFNFGSKIDYPEAMEENWTLETLTYNNLLKLKNFLNFFRTIRVCPPYFLNLMTACVEQNLTSSGFFLPLNSTTTPTGLEYIYRTEK